MRPARILLLVVAIVAGGLAAFMATRGSAPTQQVTVTEIKQEAKVQVLVASKPIGVGERLGTETLEWQDWPAGAIRPEYVTIEAVPNAPAQLTNAVARFEFFPGEPIREAKLARSDQGYLSAVIEQGMRAVSINVSAASGAGGFIVPNDRVDVVHTRGSSSGEQSDTILRNVKVLAIGVRLGEAGTSGGQDNDETTPKTFTGTTIATLELAPPQSEALINAGQTGNLTLVLRSVADFSEELAQSVSERASSIRLIRYGEESQIVTGVDENKNTEQGAEFSPVAYTPDAPAAVGDLAVQPIIAAPSAGPQVGQGVLTLE